MEKINIVELLKGCPSGMELNCTMFENTYFDYVDVENNLILCYSINDNIKTGLTFSKYGTYSTIKQSKCVIFPKGRTTWEGFTPPCQFKDGDVVVSSLGYIHILKNCSTSYIYVDFVHNANGSLCKSLTTCVNVNRLATEEEKEKLFNAIKANGYKWNEETKNLETLVESDFKDGDILSYQCAGLRNRTIYIYRYHPTMNTSYYVALGGDLDFMVNHKDGYALSGYNTSARFATEAEKAKLFQAIKDKGYKWNIEKKTLEKLPKFKIGDRIRHKNDKTIIKTINYIYYDSYALCGSHILLFVDQDMWELVPNKFDINTLKPFDKVLVRTKNFTPAWTIDFYNGYQPNIGGSFTPFGVTGGKYYQQCIPYEGNEHLRGTTNDCDEYFKTWE